MKNLNWLDQADVWLNKDHSFDTNQGPNQAYFGTAAVAFDAGFLFLRPRNDQKTYVVPASGVQRVELPAQD